MRQGWHGPTFDQDERGGSAPQDSDRRQRASELLAQYNGDAVRMAEKLADVLNDNADVREKNRALRADNADLKTKVAPDGAVILSADQAAQWTAYQALGTPVDLTTQLEQGQQAITERDTLKTDAVLREVASVAGYDFEVLKDKGGALSYTIKDEQRDGKPVRVPYVQADGAETPLHDYAARAWPKYLPALQSARATPPPAVRLPIQSATSGTAAPSDLVTRFIEQRNQQAQARPNPLIPAAKDG